MGSRTRLSHRDNVARWLYHGLVATLGRFTAIRRAKEQVEKDIPQMTPVEREIVGYPSIAVALGCPSCFL